MSRSGGQYESRLGLPVEQRLQVGGAARDAVLGLQAGEDLLPASAEERLDTLPGCQQGQVCFAGDLAQSDDGYAHSHGWFP